MEKNEWKDVVHDEVERVLLLFSFACLEFLCDYVITIDRPSSLSPWSNKLRVFRSFGGRWGSSIFQDDHQFIFLGCFHFLVSPLLTTCCM